MLTNLSHPVDFDIDYYPAVCPNKHQIFKSLIQKFLACKRMNLDIFTGIKLKINGMTETEIIDEVFKKPIKTLWLMQLLN